MEMSENTRGELSSAGFRTTLGPTGCTTSRKRGRLLPRTPTRLPSTYTRVSTTAANSTCCTSRKGRMAPDTRETLSDTLEALQPSPPATLVTGATALEESQSSPSRTACRAHVSKGAKITNAGSQRATFCAERRDARKSQTTAWRQSFPQTDRPE